MEVSGCCSVKCAFESYHSDAHCPVPELHDVMFRLGLLAMPKIVGALGKRR